MSEKHRERPTQAEIDGELRLTEIMQAAMRRADEAQAAMRDIMFKPGPPGSGLRWVLNTEPLPPGSYEIEDD